MNCSTTSTYSLKSKRIFDQLFWYFSVKACELGRQEVLKFILNDFDSIQGYSNAFWHAAKNGHSNIINLLLEKVDNIDIIDSPAPDGTSPLIMAIAKGHKSVVKCFEKTYGIDKLIAENAKFGKIYDISVNNYKMKKHDDEAMNNAVCSGDIKAIRYIKSVTNNPQFPEDTKEHVLDKDILKLTGQFLLISP